MNEPITDNGIAAALEKEGRKVWWLAEQLGVHRSTVSRWAHGTTPVPADRHDEIALLLDCDSAALFPPD